MFVPWHLKSDYSPGYATASIYELVQQAASARPNEIRMIG